MKPAEPKPKPTYTQDVANVVTTVVAFTTVGVLWGSAVLFSGLFFFAVGFCLCGCILSTYENRRLYDQRQLYYDQLEEEDTNG